MNRVRRGRRAALLADVEAALAENQPHLKIVKREPEIVIEGSFLLLDSDGPFDQHQVRILVTDGYPEQEPKVFETGGRIPRNLDRHINTDGACCPAVWEEWLVKAPDTSFKGFLEGPVHEFFLSQLLFEKKGYWRFGERSHGIDGIVEGYADVLEVTADQKIVLTYLRTLAKPWPKGHWPCPCGSGLKLRHCHHERLHDLHQHVPPRMAKRMLNRLKESHKTKSIG